MYRSKPFSRVFFKKTLALWTTNSLIYVIKIDIESNPLKNTEFHAICKACEFALKKKKSLKNFQPGFIAIPSSLYSHVHKYMIDKYVTLQPTLRRGISPLSVYPRYLSIFWLEYWFYRLWKQLERNRSPAKERPFLSRFSCNRSKDLCKIANVSRNIIGRVSSFYIYIYFLSFL